MDQVLVQTLKAELAKYTGQGANSIAIPMFDEDHHYYGVAVLDYPLRQDPADLILLARVADERIVIEEDMTDKPLVEALLQQGISREQIVLAYEGESTPPWPLGA